MKVGAKGGLNGVFILWFLMLPHGVQLSPKNDEKIKHSVIRSWAEKLGVELWHAGDFITRRKQVQDSFKQAQVLPRSGQKIADEMAKDILYMLESRISAIKRIMDAAENMAMSYEHKEADRSFNYYNAKEMNDAGAHSFAAADGDPSSMSSEFAGIGVEVGPKELVLDRDPHFFNESVDKTHSSVHVPTNVFDRSLEVISAIEWSEALDNTFKDNYNKDNTLSWQFFGSSTGFMRQFPAAEWDEDPVDLYDCRLRPWYIEAATGPKDIVILMDTSGSMTGQRKDIARHVVHNILDTLGTNDFVNMFTFALEVRLVVECFNNTLVQANMANIRQLKQDMENLETAEIANVTAALIHALDLLRTYREERIGANCNQAIMLISDGVPYNYEEIFEEYNGVGRPVRVFTYLIGREVADVKEIKAMACQNRGYYVHLSTLAEVREQVLNYIPVMARPLVLNKTYHPIIWTQFYADKIEPKMTDWSWQKMERREQRERFMIQDPELIETKNRWNLTLKQDQQQTVDSSRFQFITTISMPVYDRRENATKIANLLGVAGTDIPITDLKRLMMPYMVGVNGYAFIVTNNGHVLIHPDLRPVFEDILKPAYNSVDMAEVELMDDDSEARHFDANLLEMRDSIINQSSGSKWMFVKYHFDNMRRVSRITRQYFWTPIKDTSFTLVVTFPESYGVNRIQPRAEDEIHRLLAQGHNLTEFFSGHHWSIHPDWLYCKSKYKTYESPEKELKDILKAVSQPWWKWPLNRSPPSPEHTANFYSNSSTGSQRPTKTEKELFYCDRNLMISLVHDAKVTSEWNVLQNNKEDKGNEFKQRFGVTIIFMATHSGLTRWQEFYSNSVEETRTEHDFRKSNTRAIDELWYKRAVEHHFIEPSSFVYSVPFDAAEKNDTLVTASHAVFHTEGGKKAPAAVIGFQFRHSALVTLLQNITSQCLDGPCTKTCSSEEFDCFVLDNHGYVVVSPQLSDTGKFFGDVRGWAMQRFVQDNIYKEVLIHDYQAVCFAERDTKNAAHILQLPLKHLLRLLEWVGRLVVYMFVQLSISPAEANSNEYGDEDYYPGPTENTANAAAKEERYGRRVIQKTKPQPCDKVVSLYLLNTEKDVFKGLFDGCERPFVAIPVANSNLVLVVIDTMCTLTDFKMNTIPREMDYNNSLACHKSVWGSLSRKSLSKCISAHEKEETIELCGRGERLSHDKGLLLLGILLALLTVLGHFRQPVGWIFHANGDRPEGGLV